MQVKLKVMRGSSEGKEIRLPGPVFRIGRDESCQLRPRSDSVSRKHCEIAIGEESVTIRDLGSRNGTHVNDEKLEPNVERELQLGNVVRVGKLLFEVLVEHGLDAGKRAKVTDVKAAAARTTERPAKAGKLGDDDITGWLEEGASDTAARTIADPETRQFKLDETDRIALEGEEAEEGDDSEAEESDDPSGGSWFGGAKPKAKKKKVGKLPDRPKTQTDNSRDAAADMLKKFFNRT